MNAYLLLANGMVFAGQSVGAEGVTVGEVVFATGMVGFQETLTDPSYYGQIITQTYPLIGNYGMNHDDMESDRIWAKGYIVREACKTPSNWRCEETLDSFLKKNNTIGIEGIDTRHLTRIIRESGVMNGAILTTFDPADPANKEKTDALLAEIRAYAVTDAVKNVTCAEPEVFNPAGETHIVLMHYGCKRNIVRCLVKRGCKVTVMPAFATAEEVAAMTKRIQNAGTEVVEAKAGGGSATLSMGQAACRFGLSLIKGLQGEANVIECAYVEGNGEHATFFAQPVLLGKNGVETVLDYGKLSAFEQEAMDSMLATLKADIQLGVDFVK
jgi:hypothetical protein